MPDPRWMSVVIYQRQHGAWAGGEARPPYGDVDAEPLPAAPERAQASTADRLTVRLRSVFRAGGHAQGAVR